MEKIKIKLKECCLTCDFYYPDGIGIGSFVACGSNKREISCQYAKPTIVMAKTPLIESLDAGIVRIVYSTMDNHFAIFIANTHHMYIFAEVL